MGALSITEAQYVLLVLRQAKMSTREGAVSLLGDLKNKLDTGGRARCAADARSAVGRAVEALKDCLDERWPREDLWREALDLTTRWKAQLK
jgi:hypothetical protein